MKNMLFVLLLSLILPIDLKSQNTVGKIDDLGRISLTAYIPDQIEQIQPIAKNALENKLNQITTQNGIAGPKYNNRFILTANIVVVSKDITPTAPPMTALNLDINLYIGDGVDGILYSNTTITVKGVGANENKAYLDAIKNIKPSDLLIQKFVEKGKSKIIEYYNTRCDFLLKQSQALESQNKFEEAIFLLTSVPEVCKDCYEKSMNSIGPIFSKYIERECKKLLLNAKSTWAVSQTFETAEAVGEYLSQIDPKSSCYPEAISLAKEMSDRIRKINDREWELKQKTQIESIKAYREIGVAYGNGQPKTITYLTRGWW